MSSIPLSAPTLGVEVFHIAAPDTTLFETKVLSAQQHVAENTKAHKSVGGWDSVEKPKVEGVPEEKTWVSLTGWESEDHHAESAREVTSGHEMPRETVMQTPNVFETVHLRKVL